MKYADKELSMDTLGLSKTGLTLIRNLLQGRIKGGLQAAIDLAETLHELPEPGNDLLNEIVINRLQLFVTKYPHLAHHINKHVVFSSQTTRKTQ